MIVRRLYITGTRRGANDGHFHAGASVRSASAAFPRRGCAISRASARSAISTGPATATTSTAARCWTRWSPTCRRSGRTIAVTGDLVNLALEAEFAPAQAWLERWHAAAGHGRLGNHDAYVRATRHHFADASENICATTPRPTACVSVRAPARPAGADRRVLGGADAPLMATGRPAARSSMRSTAIWRTCRPRTPSGCCWHIIPCIRVRG